MHRSDNIVIVGGGSSGWMTATSLSQFFPEKNITVIESPDVPRIGVGESTLEHFTFWLHTAGVNSEDLFRYCDATYKFSIKFNDFYKKGDGGFHYPFGKPSTDRRIFSELGLDAFQYLKWKYPEIPNSYYATSYWPQVTLCETNKINFNEKKEFENFDLSKEYAFHFDAIMFANYLRDKVCIPRGVHHIPSTVSDIITNDDGVEKLILESGDSITADLYIDCTGFKALLLNKLGAEWLDYSHLIPNNRAWTARVPYTNPRKQMRNYTNCTALNNGWVWNTPTWSRLGTGYVYSDLYTTPEDAQKEFQEHLISQGYDTQDLQYRDVHFKIGMHKEIWKKNVVAIGLSAGFIEPLESTGLFTTLTFINRLTEIISYDGYSRFQLNEYNTICRTDFDGLAKFTAAHYMFTQRSDTQYWKDCRNRNYNDTVLPESDKLFNADYFVSEVLTRRYFDSKYQSNGGTHCIMAGMNKNPLSHWQILKEDYYQTGPSLRKLDIMLPDILEKSNARIQRWNDASQLSEYHYDYLLKTYWS